MNLEEIKYCPSTLTHGHSTYSPKALKQMFQGKKVRHILPYNSPASGDTSIFEENQQRISISGVQEKFSVLLEKNKLRLAKEGESGTYILKPIPNFGKRREQMPANEHLTMQIAKQVYGIETAENALILFKDGEPAYLTKRFDVKEDGSKIAQEDFASLAGRTPQTHGSNYKYLGNYLELFELLKKYVPAYTVEAPKLFRLIAFNYLFSNGDAHFKNFSLTETLMGDFKLSPAYDLLNSRIHIEDKDFALEDGLLPRNLGQGTISKQFNILAEQAGISPKVKADIMETMLDNAQSVEKLVQTSFLDEKAQRNYMQAYQGRMKQLKKV